jgi:preprotein translocase subunit Sec63
MVKAKVREVYYRWIEICDFRKLHVEVVVESEFYENVESDVAERHCQGNNTNEGNV